MAANPGPIGPPDPVLRMESSCETSLRFEIFTAPGHSTSTLCVDVCPWILGLPMRDVTDLRKKSKTVSLASILERGSNNAQ
ncbi:unnamed protein product, partial [Amoebophrya sp. A25]|eukprot:GSA25T00011897001.1